MRSVTLLACSLLACASTATPDRVGSAVPPSPAAEAQPEASPSPSMSEPTSTEPTSTEPASTEPTSAESPPDGEPQEPDVFSPATVGQSNCEVTVSALLSASLFRGSGAMTPARQAAFDANPDSAQRFEAEDHGDLYIECVYQVRLAHKPEQRYQWRHEVSNTLRDHTVAVCNGLAEAVAVDIVSSTKDCSDLDAGAYWGDVLAPLG